MANKTIAQLPAASAPAASDVYHTSQLGVDAQIPLSTLAAYVVQASGVAPVFVQVSGTASVSVSPEQTQIIQAAVASSSYTISFPALSGTVYPMRVVIQRTGTGTGILSVAGLNNYGGTVRMFNDQDTIVVEAVKTGGSSWVWDVVSYQTTGNYAPSGSSFSLAAGDLIRMLTITTGGSNFTLTMPAASTTPAGEVLITKLDAGVGAIAVTPTGSDNIGGGSPGAAYNIPTQYQTIHIKSNGSNGYAMITTVGGGGAEKYTPTSGYTPAVGDVVELNYDGTVRKAKRLNSSSTWNSGSTVVLARLAALDATHFVVAYTVGLVLYVQVGVVSMVDGSISFPQTATNVFTGTTTAPNFDIAEVNSTNCCLVYNTTGGAATQMYARTVGVNLSTGVITLSSATSGAASASNCQVRYIPGGGGNVICTYCASGTSTLASVISGMTGGAAPTINTASGSVTTTLALSPVLYYGLCVASDGSEAMISYAGAANAVLCTFAISGTTATAGLNTDSSFPIFTTAHPQIEEPTLYGPIVAAGYLSGAITSLALMSPRRNNANTWSNGGWAPAYLQNQTGGTGQTIFRQMEQGVFFYTGWGTFAPSGNIAAFFGFVRRKGVAGNYIFDISDSCSITGSTVGSGIGGCCTLSSGWAVLIFNTGGGATTNYVAALRRRNRVLGVAIDTGGTVQRTGSASGLSGLVTGSIYYCDDNGALTTTPTDCKIGMALSATVLDMQVIPCLV